MSDKVESHDIFGWGRRAAELEMQNEVLRAALDHERELYLVEIAALRKSLERCLSEAIGWLDDSRGCRPSDVIGYDGWDDEARKLLER
jgi:hypothetical protein